MNKTFFIAWVVVFVAWFAGSFVVHGTLLHDDYMKLSGLFRPAAEAQACQIFRSTHWPLTLRIQIIFGLRRM
jgi:hypothetical protein